MLSFSERGVARLKMGGTGFLSASSSQHTRRALPFDSCWRRKVGRRASTTSVRKHGRVIAIWPLSHGASVAACLSVSGASLTAVSVPLPAACSAGTRSVVHNALCALRNTSSLHLRHCHNGMSGAVRGAIAIATDASIYYEHDEPAASAVQVASSRTDMR